MTTQDSQLRWAVCLSHELHPRVKDAIGNNFVSEHFDLDISTAMREVEIRLRGLADADASQLGVALVRKALHPEEGPLTDLTAERGEREALGHLFAGALTVFRIPVVIEESEWKRRRKRRRSSPSLICSYV